MVGYFLTIFLWPAVLRSLSVQCSYFYPHTQAWAVYKGKYREGRDKADPTMWKTRLRCALNKSTDFHEVPERNQLDITEPYKVYRIQNSNASARETGEVKTNKQQKQ